MAEPDLLQRQREILRTFRQATAMRAQVEADAAAQLAEAHKAQEEVQAALTQAGLQRLLGRTQPTARPDVDPATQLARHVSVAIQTPASIKADIGALQRWREGEARSGSLMHR